LDRTPLQTSSSPSAHWRRSNRPPFSHERRVRRTPSSKPRQSPARRKGHGAETYGQDHLHLTVAKGYLGKLIGNERIARYLAQHQPEVLGEFRKIADMTSTLASEAA
jgi:hypothetical protein